MICRIRYIHVKRKCCQHTHILEIVFLLLLFQGREEIHHPSPPATRFSVLVFSLDSVLSDLVFVSFVFFSFLLYFFQIGIVLV